MCACACVCVCVCVCVLLQNFMVENFTISFRIKDLQLNFTISFKISLQHFRGEHFLKGKFRKLCQIEKMANYIPRKIFLLYCTILYHTVLYCTILYYTILYYTILYYTILYYTILYYTILYYTILYYTILYYTILYVCTSCTARPAGECSRGAGHLPTRRH